MGKYRILWLVFGFLSAACASGPQVSRVSADTVTDLSGYWNNTDVEIVCGTLIQACLNSRRVTGTADSLGRLPVFLVGNFSNETGEHLDTSIISETMELAIFDSERAEFVAGGGIREQLRTERQDQQGNASEETARALGMEVGADFLLTGSVKTIVDRAGGTLTRTYYVSARLTNIETGVLLWMDQNSEIKKIIKTPRARL
ncbi:MAG: penicillin-binding protein activator LpoB [Treponema sp.]|jgi:uncharacterized protein (TIGR02722 family)|nr:penicillin-binding protein activator LpoB [Treponema sp.]